MQVKTYLISEGVKYTETIIEDGYINKIYKVDNCRKDIYAIPDACIDIQFIYEKGRYVPYACGTHTKVSPAYISGSKKTFAVKFEPGVIPDFMKEYISDIVCDRKCLAYIDDIQNISSMLQNEDDFEKMVDIFMDNFRYDRHFADKKNISKTQAPSGEKVVFTIKANQLGQTLPSNDGDTLKLVDHLSSNLILNFKSIKVVNTKDSSEIKDYKASYPDNVLEIEIPNNIPLTITYEATINGPPGQNLSFSNEAYWKNYSPSGGVKVEKSDYSYTAGGSVEGTANPTLKIIKLDQDNKDVTLSGAKFKMVECQLESNGIVEKENGHS